MELSIFLYSILVLTIIVLGFYMFYLSKTIRKLKNSSTNNKNDTGLSQPGCKVWVLLILAVLLILGSFVSPYLLTLPSIIPDRSFNTNTGQIGDTIGGLMNPFIAIAGVIVTGLAFYIQYLANLQQQVQITRQTRENDAQQFESQFYEMLRLHRENVTEMKIKGYDFDEENGFIKVDEITEGRKIFVTMQTEFESILAIWSSKRTLDQENYEKCYNIFFSGLDAFEENFPVDKDLIEVLKKAKSRHQNPEKHSIKTNPTRKMGLSDYNLNFNYKPFSGHSSRLGHYFRHLYLTVKLIANSKIISDYEDKMKYLRILRAQLSNHEQVLLFYNWLGQYGKNWENENHQFFTEYKMIHNLSVSSLYSDDFISDKIKLLKDKKTMYRKGSMFEIDDLK